MQVSREQSPCPMTISQVVHMLLDLGIQTFNHKNSGGREEMTAIGQQELALPLDPVDEKEVTTVRFYVPYSWWPDGKHRYIKHAP
jgi:hypothetical protein